MNLDLTLSFNIAIDIISINWHDAVLTAMSRSPARFNCQQCTVLLTPKVTVSDKNGNKGRFFISVCFILLVEDPLL